MSEGNREIVLEGCFVSYTTCVLLQRENRWLMLSPKLCLGFRNSDVGCKPATMSLASSLPLGTWRSGAGEGGCDNLAFQHLMLQDLRHSLTWINSLLGILQLPPSHALSSMYGAEGKGWDWAERPSHAVWVAVGTLTMHLGHLGFQVSFTHSLGI